MLVLVSCGVCYLTINLSHRKMNVNNTYVLVTHHLLEKKKTAHRIIPAKEAPAKNNVRYSTYLRRISR